MSRRKIDPSSFEIYLALTRQQEYCWNGEKFVMVQRVCKDRELYALQRVHIFKFAAGPIPIRCLLDERQSTCCYSLSICYLFFVAFFSIISILPAAHFSR